MILIDKQRATYPLTVQNAMWLALGTGLGELLLRYLDARAERLQLDAANMRRRKRDLSIFNSSPGQRFLCIQPKKKRIRAVRTDPRLPLVRP